MSAAHPPSNGRTSWLPLAVVLLFLVGAVARNIEQRQERLFMRPGKPFTKTLSLLNLMLSGPKNKISPLYLINGTICRYVNSAPICTVLATTGLQTGQQGSSSGSSGSRPSSGGSSGGGSGGSSGSGGGGGGSGGSGGGSSGGSGSGSGGGGGGSNSGSRPPSAGLLGSSSVQYLGRPLADDAQDLQVGGSGTLTSAIQPNANVAFDRPVGLLVRRRPLGLFGLRRPPPPALMMRQPTYKRHSNG